MEKITFLFLSFVVVVTLGYFVVFRGVGGMPSLGTDEVPPRIVTETDTVEMEGKVTRVYNGCWSDGICSIEVDHKWWIPIIKGGSRPSGDQPEVRGEVAGIIFNEEEESVGKKVEVYARKVDETSLSIFGSEDYYVRVIGE